MKWFAEMYWVDFTSKFKDEKEIKSTFYDLLIESLPNKQAEVQLLKNVKKGLTKIEDEILKFLTSQIEKMDMKNKGEALIQVLEYSVKKYQDN